MMNTEASNIIATQTNICSSVLQIRRGKRDNLKIFFPYYSFKTKVVTHH